MKTPRVTKVMVAAAMVGAGLTGYSASNLMPYAYADPVRLDKPVAAPGFADVVEAVSPAVVSVRVSGTAPTRDVVSRNGDQYANPFRQLPEGHPFRRFWDREFGQRGPQFGERGGNRRSERPAEVRPISQGSGFFISDDGYVVTNNHVVADGEKFTVIMDDGSELEAELVGTDPRSDLAVLKVDTDRDLTYVEFGDEDATRIGDWVVAVGNPFGLGGTVTAGIVSARGRDIGSGPYDDFLQIDAAVNRGNSGGPTFNLSGEVVGINTAIFSPSGGNVGIAFAVPASVASDVVADLIEDGTVERGWLGVRIQPVTDDIAAALGLDNTNGAIVTEPEAGTPAAEAGIRSGDVIVAVDGQAVETPRDLSRIIAEFEPGTDIIIKVDRNGKTEDINVRLGELPSLEQLAGVPQSGGQMDKGPAALDGLGLRLVPSDDGQGVLITSVEPQSPAAEAGIRAGEVIREINNQPVKSAAEVKARVAEISKDGRQAALLRVEGENTSRFVAVPLPRN